jgi:AhpD family alkylhydroperoxidase
MAATHPAHQPQDGGCAICAAMTAEFKFQISIVKFQKFQLREGLMSNRLDEFQSYRTRMNNRITEINHLGINRFFNLDTNAYKEGALAGKTKELLGLVASMVLRCNDCIDYHILQCVEASWTDEELYEAFNVALVVGGSIVIPHLRHAVETLDLARQ